MVKVVMRRRNSTLLPFVLVLLLTLAAACNGGEEDGTPEEPGETPLGDTPEAIVPDGTEEPDETPEGTPEMPEATPEGTPEMPEGTPEGTPPATPEDATTEGASAEMGQEVAAEYGCLTCHTTDGTESVGPTWQGLYTSTRALASGETVEADEEYLRRSILEPDAQIAEGFAPGLMPGTFGDQMSDQEIQAVIEYIKSLG